MRIDNPDILNTYLYTKKGFCEYRTMLFFHVIVYFGIVNLTGWWWIHVVQYS